MSCWVWVQLVSAGFKPSIRSGGRVLLPCGQFPWLLSITAVALHTGSHTRYPLDPSRVLLPWPVLECCQALGLCPGSHLFSPSHHSQGSCVLQIPVASPSGSADPWVHRCLPHSSIWASFRGVAAQMPHVKAELTIAPRAAAPASVPLLGTPLAPWTPIDKRLSGLKA